MASSKFQTAEQKALSNHLILAKVFKCNETRDLKNFRLVCKAWDKEAHAELRRTVPLIVRESEGEEEGPDEVDYCARLLSEAPPGGNWYIKRTLTEMLEYLDSLPESEKCTRLRYSTVVLQGWDFTPPLTTDTGEQTRFRIWSACCQGILHLHLIRCHLNINYHLEIFLPLASKLESLTVDDKYVNRKTVSVTGVSEIQRCLQRFNRDVVLNKSLRSLTVFCCDPEPAGEEDIAGLVFGPWFSFLKELPNLEKIVLRSLDRGVSPVEYRDMLNRRTAVAIACGMVRCAMWTNKHKIRHVDMAKLDWPASGFLRPLLVDILTLTCKSDCMPLTVLKVDIGLAQFPSPEASAATLVKAFAASLETLVLIRAPYTTQSPPPFEAHDFQFLQVMESLQTLELIGSVMFDLKFLQFTPNLRKLVVSPMHRTKYSVDLMDDEAFRRDSAPLHLLHPQFANLVVGAEQSNAGLVLVNLAELEIGYPLEGRKSVDLLVRWMPNVETLRIPATAEIFREICRRWGDSLHTLKLLNPSLLNDGDITVFGKAASSLSPQVPNVRCLNNLKSFQMEHPHPVFYTPSECDHLVPQLTERSIVHGFAKLDKLQILKIFVTKALGKKCLQALNSRRGELSVVAEVVANCKCNISGRPPRRTCRR